MRCWPFLIAASRRFDYRTVICPDFVDSGPRDLFQKHLDPRSYAAEGTIHTARAETREVGPVSIFYRTEFVRDTKGPDEFVYDGSGRRIYFTYGVVLAGNPKGESIDKVAVENLIDSYRPDIVAHQQRVMASRNELPLAISQAEDVPSVSREAVTRDVPRPSHAEKPAATRPPSPASRRPPSADPPRSVTPNRSPRKIFSGVWALLLLASVAVNAYLLWTRFSSEEERAWLRAVHSQQLASLKAQHAREMERLERGHAQAVNARDMQWQVEMDRLKKLIAVREATVSPAAAEPRAAADTTAPQSERGSKETKGPD
jgi:hypothetical protein